MSGGSVGGHDAGKVVAGSERAHIDGVHVVSLNHEQLTLHVVDLHAFDNLIGSNVEGGVYRIRIDVEFSIVLLDTGVVANIYVVNPDVIAIGASEFEFQDDLLFVRDGGEVHNLGAPLAFRRNIVGSGGRGRGQCLTALIEDGSPRITTIGGVKHAESFALVLVLSVSYVKGQYRVVESGDVLVGQVEFIDDAVVKVIGIEDHGTAVTATGDFIGKEDVVGNSPGGRNATGEVLLDGGSGGSRENRKGFVCGVLGCKDYML